MYMFMCVCIVIVISVNMLLVSFTLHYTQHTHNHFTALRTLSGTTRVSWYQKVHFAIFWIFWCKIKITQTDTPTIRMDCHPYRLIGAAISAIPTIFMPDAHPGTTLPMYPGLGQAPNMLACIPDGWLHYTHYCMLNLLEVIVLFSTVFL